MHYLIENKGYPASWILIEKEIKVFQTRKRFDIVVTKPKGEHHILIECKRPSVAINQEVFDQIARYNLNLQSHFLMVSNGLDHYFCKMDYQKNQYAFIEDLPNYTNIK